MAASGVDKHPGFPAEVADTVGAGDAFTAALVHHYLRGASLAAMNEAANRMGAWVASQMGATPKPDVSLSKGSPCERATAGLSIVGPLKN